VEYGGVVLEGKRMNSAGDQIVSFAKGYLIYISFQNLPI